MQEDIIPKNIIMIGPTGVGKTEISRRIARLADAPFVKVEATRYTEVGYVGRDVESIIRDLTDTSYNMVKAERMELVRPKADEAVKERMIDLLMPARKNRRHTNNTAPRAEDTELYTVDWQREEEERRKRIREKLVQQYELGELDDRPVELEVKESNQPVMMGITGPMGGDEGMFTDIKEMVEQFMPQRSKNRKVTVAEAKRILLNEEMEKLIDGDALVQEAIKRVESSGIVFLDEIDKIAGHEAGHSGPDVSREGVQRDLLPIVEGATVKTKHGLVKTDHILFIAAGAFNVSKPSDLIPELQGRFPIRVELDTLSKDDFVKILTLPQNALIKQYIALLSTEKVSLEFTEDAIDTIAELAQKVNDSTENIGARRLHTMLEKLLEEVSFQAPDPALKGVVVDSNYVRTRLADLVKNEDLSRYIL